MWKEKNKYKPARPVWPPKPFSYQQLTLGQWLDQLACVSAIKAEGIGNASYESLGLHCGSATEGKGEGRAEGGGEPGRLGGLQGLLRARVMEGKAGRPKQKQQNMQQGRREG